ncbi:cytochrome B [Mucilaginibacter sp. NFR10]|uniref:cytochrome B n=1 Tax=Mucilaginibacter sp. NFR10 TaxID=1566292 RepID=UPI000871A01B|nr:cytochrome B [Mucilaginibacter sp. NFR10]SCW87997.1 hypothetical protein SAMN03159284_05321 [Mucilaginibacter sp. NFR10]
MTLYSFFKEFHSGFRYIVIVLVLLALIRAFMGWLGKRPYGEGNRKLNLFAMISVHTQFLLGIILYFLSSNVQFTKETMKNPITRYWTVEHWVIMLIAIALITIGHSKSKKAALPEGKHKAIAIFYLIGVVLISVGIMLIPQ